MRISIEDKGDYTEGDYTEGDYTEGDYSGGSGLSGFCGKSRKPVAGLSPGVE